MWRPGGAWRQWQEGLAVFVGHAVLAVAFTWPLATGLGRLGVPNQDYYINTWVLAWDIHQAARDPWHLFDSNIFHPTPRSLAYNESLLPEAATVAPILLFGGSALLAHNLAFLATFPLCGLSGYLLARELSGSRGGALLASVGFAFCPFRFHWVNNVQCVSLEWLPLAILFLLRALRGGGGWNLLGLVLTAVAQALSCAYYALFLPAALGLAWLYGVHGAPRRRDVVHATLAILLAAALAFVAFLPYRALQKSQGLVRGMNELLAWSARPGSYLNPGRHVALPHQRLLAARFGGGDPLYPGAVVIVFAAAGALATRRPGPARLATALTAAGVLLSLGPRVHLGPWNVPGPFELLRAVPGAVPLIHTPARFGALALLGFAVLASLGWAALAARHPRLRIALVPVLALLLVEDFPAGLRWTFRPIPEPPPAIAWLKAAPRGPVLELPWNEDNDATLYVYWSVFHWQPLVDGAGSFEPRGYFWLGLIGKRWPTPYTARVYRDHGIRYVVVHTDRLTPGQRQRLFDTTDLPRGVSLAAELQADRVYAIEPSVAEGRGRGCANGARP